MNKLILWCCVGVIVCYLGCGKDNNIVYKINDIKQASSLTEQEIRSIIIKPSGFNKPMILSRDQETEKFMELTKELLNVLKRKPYFANPVSIDLAPSCVIILNLIDNTVIELELFYPISLFDHDKVYFYFYMGLQIHKWLQELLKDELLEMERFKQQWEIEKSK